MTSMAFPCDVRAKRLRRKISACSQILDQRRPGWKRIPNLSAGPLTSMLRNSQAPQEQHRRQHRDSNEKTDFVKATKVTFRKPPNRTRKEGRTDENSAVGFVALVMLVLVVLFLVVLFLVVVVDLPHESSPSSRHFFLESPPFPCCLTI